MAASVAPSLILGLGRARGTAEAQYWCPNPNPWSPQSGSSRKRTQVCGVNKGSSSNDNSWDNVDQSRRRFLKLRGEEGEGKSGLAGVEDWGEPVSLGTAILPEDVNLAKLQELLFQVNALPGSIVVLVPPTISEELTNAESMTQLYAYLTQWGSSLTQTANLPLPLPLKVDKVAGGVRLGYIKLTDGLVEDLVHIDVIVAPGVGGAKPTFQASRNGRYKAQVPPGEPVIMQSLLQALRKSVVLAKNT